MKLTKAQIRKKIMTGKAPDLDEKAEEFFKRQATNFRQLAWYLLKRAKFTRKLMHEFYYIEYGRSSIDEMQAFDLITRFKDRLGDLIMIRKEIEKYVLQDIAVRVTKIRTIDAMKQNGEI